MKLVLAVGGILFVLCGLLMVEACGGSGGAGQWPEDVVSGADEPVPAEPEELSTKAPDDNSSRIDLNAFTVHAPFGTTGSSVSLPGGPTVTAQGGTQLDDVALGIRKVEGQTAPEGAGTVLSDFFEVAASVSDLMLKKGSTQPITLSIPVTVPAEAIGHPGLYLLATVGGLTVPLEGTYDQASGLFKTELMGLPPSTVFAVAFNPNVKVAYSDDIIIDVPHDLPADSVGFPWSTVNWKITYDGNVLTADQEKKALTFAKRAATIYSEAGFMEPFLLKIKENDKEYWQIFLTVKGSCYETDMDRQAHLAAKTFGRQYLDVGRIDSPKTGNIGSGQASVAHELFHAIFFNYAVPYECYYYQEDGQTYCARSSISFNEGMATALGYYIDQGSPAKPRPNQKPNYLARAFGYFLEGDTSYAYETQDFYVYLLRVSSIQTFRTHLQALASAPLTGPFMDKQSLMSRYAIALNSVNHGLGNDFASLYSAYVADRGYLRTPEGHIWPDEPAPTFPAGTTNAIAAKLFDANTWHDFKKEDCGLVPAQKAMVCQATFTAWWNLGGHVVNLSLPKVLPNTPYSKGPVNGMFLVTSSSGVVRYAAFAEKNNRGIEGKWARSDTGAAVTLTGLGKDAPMVRLTVVTGGGVPAEVKVLAMFPQAEPEDVVEETDDAEGWTDPATGFLWQNPGSGWMDWDEAVAYCAGMGSGWRLPTVSELRTLFQNCPAVESSGACGFTDGCVAHNCSDNTPCGYNCDVGSGPGVDGCYWSPELSGTCTAYWSGTLVSDYEDSAFYAQFESGTVDTSYTGIDYRVRCINR